MPPLFRTRKTLPYAPLPSTLSSSKLLMPTLWSALLATGGSDDAGEKGVEGYRAIVRKVILCFVASEGRGRGRGKPVVKKQMYGKGAGCDCALSLCSLRLHHHDDHISSVYVSLFPNLSASLSFTGRVFAAARVRRKTWIRKRGNRLNCAAFEKKV